ncbi:MAG: HD domain-containing phosphohydrolase [Candidatus Cloacimonadaceae bacterium]|jgi:HD-GYP domain-containing protein (c-di-GMP phosphodiesterase class II)|nr:HD domain-containing protein [Candidatus Cloacimonadota bacterium]MDY0128097.1 HD domain-containing phosphohydrolase [Candidatus Cloacimonadaceae bacterium]MCB5254053.1 HD domain-containing protein [Candidatus Cloacimonadota bacterium]MCK9178776.1 HD domain-containing protein [Candidatus Cloacimonadota bacterium]MCK9242450.1 HD domain-containing protein [Candidatus Cloacimonadota bacterium]
MKYTFNANPRVNKTLSMVVETISSMADEQLKHIQQLTKIGQSLSSETDLSKIFDMILDEGVAFTKADGATIYRVNEDATALEFEIVYNGTMKMRQGGSHGAVNWKPVPLYDEKGNPELSYIVTAVYHKKQGLCFDDVYQTKDYDISGTINFDKNSNYRCEAMLTIPLKDHEDTVLGVIQFINPLTPEGEVNVFSDEHRAMLSSLASQAAIALSNRKLIESLENLLMEFMRSIAGAIERKSKYSSNHITRVALLTDMIAEKINETEEGHYSDVHFSENELKEISMSGWMHDVGKIITPEFVMDKSTKLERIMDGVHLVQERIAHIKTLLRYLKLSLSEQDYQDFVKEHINKDAADAVAYLDEASHFVQGLNIGGEFVPDETLAKMQILAEIDFEYEGHRYQVLDDLDKKNLSIRRGTLNTDELKVMRDHVSITWEMLSELSFPKKYKNVAFYAASHHEALNGSGYPRGLSDGQLPLPSRIIAIADIFEALTSADRPYKTPKTLSESLKIIAIMVKQGHLDPDLVDFFLDSGLYLEFAKQHMSKDQIDDVDISLYKSQKKID